MTEDFLIQPSPSLDERVLRLARTTGKKPAASTVAGNPMPTGRVRRPKTGDFGVKPGSPARQAARASKFVTTDIDVNKFRLAAFDRKNVFSVGGEGGIGPAMRRPRLGLAQGLGEADSATLARLGKVGSFGDDVAAAASGASAGGMPLVSGEIGPGAAKAFEAQATRGAAGAADDVAKVARLGKLGKFALGGGVGLAALGLEFAGPSLLEAGREAFIEGYARDKQDLSREQMEKARQAEQFMQLSQMRTQRLTEQAMIQLATKAPHLFNESAAGRRLPRGATVIGGQPNVDVLGQVAARLASGEYMQVSDPAVQMLADAQMRGL